jgi:hypothetical protein
MGIDSFVRLKHFALKHFALKRLLLVALPAALLEKELRGEL